MTQIPDNIFNSELFKGAISKLELPGATETVFESSKTTPNQLKEALSEIKVFAVLGYSSQGPAHAANIRDSISKLGLDDKRVIIGLRTPSSPESEARYKAAEEAGFDIVSPEEATKQADFIAMLIGDSGQVDSAEDYIKLMKPGATLGFAHGFYPLWRRTSGLALIREDIDIIANCPKGMGPTVRLLYEMGSGINSSFAVEQDYSGNAIDKALAWAMLIGSPFAFKTTLEKEAKSDLTGERAILLGGVDAITAASYNLKIANGYSPNEAYSATVESLVGPIAETIKQRGLLGLYEMIPDEERELFQNIYNEAYPGLRSVTEKIYSEVSSGQEIERVIEDGRSNKPMENIAEEPMWADNLEYRKMLRNKGIKHTEIDTTTAALYTAGMIAQVDTLLSHGHNWTEVVNESIIEAFASLLPFMKKGGLVEMVDGCSITARRGDRAWRGVFINELEKVLEKTPSSQNNQPAQGTANHFADFNDHPVHIALEKLAELQPRDKDGNIISLVA